MNVRKGVNRVSIGMGLIVSCIIVGIGLLNFLDAPDEFTKELTSNILMYFVLALFGFLATWMGLRIIYWLIAWVIRGFKGEID